MTVTPNTCIRCGEQLKPGDRFCERCGQAVEEKDGLEESKLGQSPADKITDDQNKSDNNDRSHLKLSVRSSAILAIGILGLVVIIAYLAYQLNDTRSTMNEAMSNPGYWKYKGDEAENAGKLEESIQYYDNALKLSPKGGTYSEILVAQGIAYKELGSIQEAKKKNSEALNSFHNASDCFLRATIPDPRNFDAFYRRGIAENELGNTSSALPSIDEAIRLVLESAWEMHDYKSKYLNSSDAKQVMDNATLLKKMEPKKMATLHSTFA